MVWRRINSNITTGASYYIKVRGPRKKKPETREGAKEKGMPPTVDQLPLQGAEGATPDFPVHDFTHAAKTERALSEKERRT